jgi:hypothetical protein
MHNGMPLQLQGLQGLQTLQGLQGLQGAQIIQLGGGNSQSGMGGQPTIISLVGNNE